jgi:hypothetical protein
MTLKCLVKDKNGCEGHDARLPIMLFASVAVVTGSWRKTTTLLRNRQVTLVSVISLCEERQEVNNHWLINILTNKIIHLLRLLRNTGSEQNVWKINYYSVSISIIVMYTLCNKNRALKIFEVPKRMWCKRKTGIIIPIIRNLLISVCVWIFSAFH